VPRRWPENENGEQQMTKIALLKKIETILDDFERGREYGVIEIQISAGEPALIRKATTEKLLTRTGENNRGQNHFNR
jgi:hypothetical protein